MKFVPVQPISTSLQIGRGRFFAYAMPPGWSVGEDGQFALTLIAPDRKALTIMVGNAGVPPNYHPGQFAWDKMMALGPQSLSFGQPQQAPPIAGFAHAFDFEVAYFIQGVPCRGLIKVSIAPAYDSATMAMTAALSAADRWPAYATWLPQVANQVAAIDGAAFGMRGLMQQNLSNSMAYAEAASAYRSWSQKNWQDVTEARGASEDRRNTAFRENLGAVQTYADPFGAGRSLELPTKFARYWTDRNGNVVGTDDPSADPNAGSTAEWRRLELLRSAD